MNKQWSCVKWGVELSHKRQLILSKVERSSVWLPPEDSGQSIKCGQEKDSPLCTTLQDLEFALPGKTYSDFQEQRNKTKLTN